jgi:hypothetical protein
MPQLTHHLPSIALGFTSVYTLAESKCSTSCLLRAKYSKCTVAPEYWAQAEICPVVEMKQHSACFHVSPSPVLVLPATPFQTRK